MMHHGLSQLRLHPLATRANVDWMLTHTRKSPLASDGSLPHFEQVQWAG